MSLAQKDPRRFLVAAGKELAVILGDDFNRLRTVLAKIKGPGFKKQDLRFMNEDGKPKSFVNLKS